ncbi:MAG: hypothetical protein GY849_02480 [Deltaproteobacteria bacterium]|nr:hypothetical protein [Deltaproteobacteria bacterium]
MIKPKKKKCKGTGQAKGFGCGEIVFLHKYGLCSKCFREFFFLPENSELRNKFFISNKKKVEKEIKEEKKEEKESIKRLADYKADLQKLINKIVRLIDFEKGCVSCNHGWNSKKTRQMHAGHYYSVGANPKLRFNLFNIFVQCSICNNWKSANEHEYRKGLIKIYGNKQIEITENLKVKHKDIKFSKEEIIEAKKKARIIIKKIKQGQDFSREYINHFINLYN